MSTRDRVLEALKAAEKNGVSGEALAQELGVSRVAVAKHVAALRVGGYRIEARRGEGYRLLASPDLVVPAEVAPLLSHPMWVRVEGADETDSTNDDARALARGGAPEGTAVVAARQRKGRGRLGREWSSPGGGAYISVVLRPQMPPADTAPLPLVIGLGVAWGLESLGVCPKLKWPNDLRLGEGKVAGVLLEMSAESDRVDWIVAGVGLNVAAPEQREPGAAYLQDVVAVGSAQAAAAVLDGIAEAYERWKAEGFSAMNQEYERRHALSGADVVVRDAGGAIRASGQVVGIDSEGHLLVQGASGRSAVSAGDVTLRDPHR